MQNEQHKPSNTANQRLPAHVGRPEQVSICVVGIQRMMGVMWGDMFLLFFITIVVMHNCSVLFRYFVTFFFIILIVEFLVSRKYWVRWKKVRFSESGRYCYHLTLSVSNNSSDRNTLLTRAIFLIISSASSRRPTDRSHRGDSGRILITWNLHWKGREE